MEPKIAETMMNDNDEFDMSDIRGMQEEAVKYCYRQDLLTAKINYRDRMHRLDFLGTKGVIRQSNLIVEIPMGIAPILFMEN